MIFAMNCTDALNMAIKGVLAGDAKSDDHVITTVLEHNSVSRPLQAMADQGRIQLTRIACDEDGFVDPDAIKRYPSLDHNQAGDVRRLAMIDEERALRVATKKENGILL